MERGDLSQAVEQGMKAIASLERAQKQGGEAPNGSSDRSIGEAAGDARDKLRDVMERAERAREEMQDHANDNARDKLEGAAKREQQLAERARELRKQSEDSEAPLPQQNLERLREAAEAMDRAARSLERGRGHKGQAEQREAQRLLEMAQPEQEQEPSKSNDGDGKDFARDADVPPENRDERADAFRKRVTEGLGRKAPPHLREALRRYTEGLLR
jgi:hypothetical protein